MKGSKAYIWYGDTVYGMVWPYIVYEMKMYYTHCTEVYVIYLKNIYYLICRKTKSQYIPYSIQVDGIYSTLNITLNITFIKS